MKILVAQHAGFCMGVRRAVDIVLDAAHKSPGPIYTFGPIIHNPQVLSLLEEKGIFVLDEIPENGSGTIIIRAHGVPPETHRLLHLAGFRVEDATCPRVAKVQGIIQKQAAAGGDVVIIGDPRHPEVIGLQGCAGNKAHVVASLGELQNLPRFNDAAVVFQTTQSMALFRDCHEWLRDVVPHYTLHRTICNSTQKRQQETRNLAERVKAMIVVGGKSSGNTRRLAEISKAGTGAVYHVEQAAELDDIVFDGVDRVGITAGASTPNWTIKDVYHTLNNRAKGTTGGVRDKTLIVQRFLLMTNLWVAMGAAGLCAASGILFSTPEMILPLLVSFFYVQSMHTVNHLTGGRADKYNDPERERFYQRHHRPLWTLSILSGLTGLFFAFLYSWAAFLLLAGMTLLGGIYNLRILPWGRAGKRLSGLKDLPGAKTLLITLSWGVLTGFLPLLGANEPLQPSTIAPILLVTSLVFVRTSFFDILDMQGDRIMGRETIALLLGERRTMRMLRFILGGVFCGTLGALVLFNPSAFTGLLLICPVMLYFSLKVYEREKMRSDIRLRFMVESHFVVIGLLALAWSLLA